MQCFLSIHIFSLHQFTLRLRAHKLSFARQNWECCLLYLSVWPRNYYCGMMCIGSFSRSLKVFKSKSIIILIDFSYFFSSFSFPGEQNNTKHIQHDFTESHLGHTPHQYWGKFSSPYLFWTKVILYKSRDELFSWKQNSRFVLVLGRPAVPKISAILLK